MRRVLATMALGVALATATVASAQQGAPSSTCTRPHGCLGRWTPMVIRLHAGLGAFLNGGAVTAGTAAPDLLEHARLSAQLAGEIGARPFGGGTVISLVLASQVADGAVVGTFGLSLEYDVLYLFDRDPDRDFAFALGGALAMDYAHTTSQSAAGVTWSYDLLRPDWRLYAELRIRTSERERALIRLQAVTGFDDLLDLASLTLCAGWVIDAL